MATLNALLEVGSTLSQEQSLPELLHRVVGTLCRLTDGAAGIVYLLDRMKQHLVPKAAVVDGEPHTTVPFAPIPLYLGDQRNDAQVAAHTVFLGRAVTLGDVSAYTGFRLEPIPLLGRLAGERGVPLLAVPLLGRQGQSVGAMVLFGEPGGAGAFGEERQLLARALAGQAALAVDNAQLLADKQSLVSALSRSNEELEQENRRLRRVAERSVSIRTLIAASPQMREVMALVDRLRDADVTVLIQGETGTGKEVVANALHRSGHRHDRPFIVQNCAAMPEHLLESEFFGHKRGAFTGATENKVGLFEAANGGTLFLDEIGDMPLGLQSKILRVLQEREVRPLGSLESRRIDVRVIAATNCDLRGMIGDGRFREDLYYRLSVFPIRIPPLRERPEDVPDLLFHFLKVFSGRYQKSVAGFAPPAYEALLRYRFPGNVRELCNIVERAVLLADPTGMIGPAHLPADLLDGVAPVLPVAAGQSLKEQVQRYEAALIAQRLNELGGNQSRTARELGISRRALIDKVSRYNL
ncbi:sigma 54-interacting transcriptional regulator [Azospirillum sp. ST 5-10]|uniref:sigma-54-dependent Fis family transcriptional regulator n=1 Tax=unclassified Azospirillum TaxID=2630922 RepID=UPI003F4A5F61